MINMSLMGGSIVITIARNGGLSHRGSPSRHHGDNSKGDHILLKKLRLGYCTQFNLLGIKTAGATGKIARQRSLVSQKSPMKQVTKEKAESTYHWRSGAAHHLVLPHLIPDWRFFPVTFHTERRQHVCLLSNVVDECAWGSWWMCIAILA